MKKIAAWTTAIAFIIFLIDWGVIGLKLLNGDYDITVGAYIGIVCLALIVICAVCRAFSGRCPHCGKFVQSGWQYCPHCGKKTQ